MSSKSKPIQPWKSEETMLQMVEQLAMKEGVNVEVLDRCFAQLEKLRVEHRRELFEAALARVQGKIPIIPRNGTITIREKGTTGKRDGEIIQSSKYPLYEDIVELVIPILSAEGLSITHISNTEERVKVETFLSGYGYEGKHTTLTLMHDTSGSKNTAQAVVSSLSYAKRANLCALLSIAARGEDDNGVAAASEPALPEGMPEKQMKQVAKLVEDSGCPERHLIKYLNGIAKNGAAVITALSDIPASRFEETMAALRSYEAKKKARDANSNTAAGE